MGGIEYSESAGDSAGHSFGWSICDLSGYALENSGCVYGQTHCSASAERWMVGDFVWNARSSGGLCDLLSPNPGGLGGKAVYDFFVEFLKVAKDFPERLK